MSVTLLKECQCELKKYDCPYHVADYDVYLWSSWNNWSNGFKAKIKRIKTNHIDECDKPIYIKKYEVFIPTDLQIGIYEYKWQFVDKYSNNVFWILDEKQEIIQNDGWNANNLYIVS